LNLRSLARARNHKGRCTQGADTTLC